MRILVIGGTNFMGPLVVRTLHTQGHNITVFHRGQTPTELPDSVQEILGDRRPLTNVASILQKTEPEFVLDMIPSSEQDAQEVMRTFSGIARRVVSISSQDVYRAFGRVNKKESGPVDPRRITEDSPLRENLYPYRAEPPRDADDPQKWQDDYDKILVERVVMGDPNLPGTILRLPMVYGPGDYQHRMFAFLKRMDDQRPAIHAFEEREHAVLVISWSVDHRQAQDGAGEIGIAHDDALNQDFVVIVLPFLGIIRI